MAFDRNEVQAYITEAARRRGIDPATALRVIKQESGFNPAATNLSPKEKSYGLMQLNTQGGLGVHALEKGINIRDPNTWRQQVDFGLDVVAKDGWRQWYGARDTGVGRWDGIGGRPGAGSGSPLVGAVADRQMAGGQGSQTVRGDAGNDTLGGGAGTSTGQSTAPSVEIGLSPEQKGKGELYDALVARGMQMGGNAKNVWDAVGGLAQVWAGTSEKKKLEDGEQSELVKAYAARNLSPDEQVIASAKGGRKGLADVLTTRKMNEIRTAERSEAQAWRQDERDYRRGRDTVEDQRWKAEQDRLAQGTLPAGYRRTETGMEAIPGGPADASRPDPNFKPSIQTVYDDQGREQKGYFDQGGKWTTMGGPKAASGGGNGMSVTMPDGTVVQMGGGMKLTEGQSKDLNYYQRGNAALPTIEKNEAALTSAAQNGLNAVPGVGNYLTSDEYQTANQAGKEFLAAVLRKDTGAAITKQEFDIYGPMFLPQPGDGATVLEQKRAARTRALEAMKNGLGSAQPMAQMPVTPNPGTPQPGNAPAAAPPRAGLVPGSDAGAEMPPPNRAPAAPVDYRARYGLE